MGRAEGCGSSAGEPVLDEKSVLELWGGARCAEFAYAAAMRAHLGRCERDAQRTRGRGAHDATRAVTSATDAGGARAAAMIGDGIGLDAAT